MFELLPYWISVLLCLNLPKACLPHRQGISSGWMRKHGILSSFIVGHQRKTGTGVVVFSLWISQVTVRHQFQLAFAALFPVSRVPKVQVLMSELCHANLTSWALVHKWQYRVLCFCIEFFMKLPHFSFMGYNSSLVDNVCSKCVFVNRKSSPGNYFSNGTD